MPSPRFRTCISEKRIARIVRKLAARIDRYACANRIPSLSVVCVLDGAFMFCADLVRAMQTPTTVVFVKARSYDGTRSGRLSVSRLPEAIRGRPVLVVDTIYDTGKTIAKVLAEVRKRASQIALAILVEKHGKAAHPPDATAAETFVGIRIHGDPFLVGYGLDVSGRFRHLRDIRIYPER